LASANIDNIEGPVPSQEGNPQTRSGTSYKLQKTPVTRIIK